MVTMRLGSNDITRTRTDTAGTAHSASWKLSASIEGY
jgi:hypothetical protein